MRALSVAELLSAWERAYPERPAERALTLLAAAAAEDDGDVRALSVGERDARLLTLRENTFGTALESVASCNECGEKMDLRLTTSDVRAPPASRKPTYDLELDGYRIEWRLPTSGELAGLSPAEGFQNACRALEERCILGAVRDGDRVPLPNLPAHVREALAGAVADADPQAGVELAIRCPSCARENLVAFDVATFLWDELNGWAQQTLSEVHELALAYGWSERDILSMTPFRRQIYLEMQGA